MAAQLQALAFQALIPLRQMQSSSLEEFQPRVGSGKQRQRGQEGWMSGNLEVIWVGFEALQFFVPFQGKSQSETEGLTGDSFLDKTRSPFGCRAASLEGASGQ